MEAAEVLDKVGSLGCKHLVLTGGEPLMHQSLLRPLLTSLRSAGYYVEVETNGTFAPRDEIAALVDCFNVSPKISNSLVEEDRRLRPQALKTFAKNPKAWFKFVVCKDGDLAEIEGLIMRFSLPRERVILMPEGTDAETILERSRWLVEICKEKGFRFSPRLQILLFGNRRGT